MDENNTLFIDGYLSDFLNKKISNFFSNIKFSIEEGKSLIDLKNELNSLKSNILNIEYDINYIPTPNKRIIGERPFQHHYWYSMSRFKFIGNKDFFFLQPNKFNFNPPIGLVKDNFLYFEIIVPYVEDIQKLNELSIIEINSYKERLDFYINSQNQDVEKFVNENLIKLESKYNSLIKEKLFVNNFVEEFTKSIKNNLLTKESTEVPENKEDIEQFIKELKGKNGK